MVFRGDERAQAIQVGAVLLFAALIIAFSTYQAFVVPQQNRQVEFSHNQRVQGALQELRNAIVSVPGEKSAPSVSIPLGTQYPNRLLALNPGPPMGTLRTAGTTNPAVSASLRNATTDGETGDFWDGRDHSYNTGALVYSPDYNLYTRAPRTVYENTVLFNQYRERTLPLTGARLISGRQINLVALNGSLSATRSGSLAVDLQTLSSSTRTVSVINASAGSNVTLTVPTRYDAGTWRELLSTERGNDGYVYNVTTEPIPDSPFDRLLIRLESGVRYSVQLTRVGVGTGTTVPDEAYLTTVSGGGSAVPEGSTQELVVEVRDRFNNPVSGVEVNASANRSVVRPTTETTDGDGRISFTYQAPENIDGSPKSVAVNASLVVDPGAVGSFDRETVQNVTFSLTVQNTDGSGTGGGGGGGGAYSVSWVDPDSDNPNAALSNCDADRCVWDVGASPDSTLTLRGSTNPSVEGVTLDFGVNDSEVASISPSENTTASTGDATTDLSANAEGTVAAFVASGGSSDDIVIEIQNFVAGFLYNGDATAVDEDNDGTAAAVRFSMDNEFTQSLTINEVEIDPQDGDVEFISDGQSGEGPYLNELYVDASPSTGLRDYGGGTTIPSGGLNMDLSVDREAVVDGGTTATYYLSRFYDEAGNSGNFNQEGMADETVDVTVRYTLASGATNSTSFTIQP